MRGRYFGLFAALAIAAPLSAQAPDPNEARVKALAHPRYAEREKAARDLEAAGEPALKALKAAQSSNDEELRARAAVVAEKIERTARSKRLLVAPKLALKFDEVPLDRAVTELANKTGLRFTVDASKIKDVKRPITLNTGEVAFWDAIDAFYQAAGLTEDDSTPAPAADGTSRVQIRGANRLMIRYSQPPLLPTTRLVDGKLDPAATGSAFRVRALPASFAQNKYDDEKGEITLHLDVDPAPGLNILELEGVEIRKAIADDRRALAAAYPAAAAGPEWLGAEAMLIKQIVVLNGEMMLDDGMGGAGSRFPVTIKSGGSRPRQLAELHGVVVARIVAPPEPVLTVSDVFGKGKDQVCRSEGLTCQVTALEKNAPRPSPIRSNARQPADLLPSKATEYAAFTVRLVSTGDTANEILNLPVQIKGRLQPFLRINRRSGMAQPNLPEFQVLDADGKPLRILATRPMESNFDGTTMSQAVQIVVDKPAKGLDGVSFTILARRPVVVEMPFVLKDVPLP